eukprot:CAMPEP_0184511134 /NCGR_PEP_ID=MMETSP0198_2-20121128/2184_1 /TAXON_ID=1112570 /ORGANISM="Thraustochytrium sp., Strain LLF1b" /LENGTH=302 /DNA_ID=CAMNT_0026901069 /DNA_START=52 /DNA_END=960 /DNA_ORIENTATION=+
MLGAVVSRVVVWCDSVKSVERAHEFFITGLKFANRQELKRGGVGLSSAANQGWSAGVSDGRTAIDFVAPKETSAVRRHPGRVVSSVLMQPLAWLDQPCIHPLVILDQHVDTAESSQVEPYTRSHIKEIVIGEAEERLANTNDFFSALSSRRLSPGVTSFGTGSETSVEQDTPVYMHQVPVVRVIPSPASSLVIKVQDVEETKAQLSSFAKMNKIGMRDMDDVQVLAPFLQGLDLRITAGEKFQSRFMETPLATLSTSSVEFGRTDMGSMSCTSVSGMEMKERFSRLPREFMDSLDLHARRSL